MCCGVTASARRRTLFAEAGIFRACADDACFVGLEHVDVRRPFLAPEDGPVLRELRAYRLRAHAGAVPRLDVQGELREGGTLASVEDERPVVRGPEEERPARKRLHHDDEHVLRGEVVQPAACEARRGAAEAAPRDLGEVLTGWTLPDHQGVCMLLYSRPIYWQIGYSEKSIPVQA